MFMDYRAKLEKNENENLLSLSNILECNNLSHCVASNTLTEIKEQMVKWDK